MTVTVSLTGDAMQEDRIRWNRKYADSTYPNQPSEIVTSHLQQLRAGRALDIAAGNGRNSVFLAEQGYQVDAVDISDAGLRLFAGKNPGVQTICADLDRFDIRPGRYDLILNIKYLNRRLFPYIRDGLKAGGLLIFETYLKTRGAQPDQPFCDDHLLRTNELLHAFLGLRIIYYCESIVPGQSERYPLASLVALRQCCLSDAKTP
jgi:SAM-dependent methyltransferase